MKAVVFFGITLWREGRPKAGCSAMAISQTGTLTETPFCIRQLESERIIKEMVG